MGRYADASFVFSARRQASASGELCPKCARSTSICRDCRDAAEARCKVRRAERRAVRSMKEQGTI